MFDIIQTASSKQKNDIFFLAAFPKSGSTWLSFMIANIYNALKGDFKEVDFHNIHDIIPNFPLHRDKQPHFQSLPWVYRTHFPYREEFKNVILLLRDPWDLMFSYYHYLRGERKRNLPLPDLVPDEKKGVAALSAFSSSYTRNCRNLLITTYENMHRSPGKELGKIMNFLGLDVEDALIRKASGNSAFSVMRTLEEKKGRKYGTKEFLFTRSGKTGEGKTEIGKYPELDRFILNEIKKSPVLYLLYG